MEIKEKDERIAIAKPVASRPSCSNYGKPTFSELLAGAINSQPSRVYPDQGHNIVPAIRPKALRLKPTNNSHAKEFVGSSNNNVVVFKPLAKVVSNTTFPFQTNNLRLQSSNLAEPIIKDAEKSIPLTSVADRRPTSCDGYNWRKYGQKHVKGSEYPRSYYKCTHPNCPVKKMVERSLAGHIAEIVYKGEHNHSKPQLPKGNSKVGDHRDIKNKEIVVNEESELVGTLEMADMINQITSDVLMVENFRRDICEELNEVKNKNKKRKMEAGTANPMDNEISNDGYRWRKYGQKVVKGNQYPRSYYRCTGPKCKVRKHIERVSDDPMAFITTYEGKHNHDV